MGILPIDDQRLERTNTARVGSSVLLGDGTSVTYFEGMKAMGVDIFIDLRNTAHTITADVDVNAGGNRVILCQGGRLWNFLKIQWNTQLCDSGKKKKSAAINQDYSQGAKEIYFRL